MNPQCLATVEANNEVSASIYQHENGDMILWLKIGQALLEIKPEMIDDLITILSEADTFFFDKEQCV